MHWLFGIVGIIVGGVVGYFAFWFLFSQGLYAMVLPGALVGLGCGSLSRKHSIGLGIVSAITALLLGLFLDWKFLPFAADNSLSFFVKNLHHLPPASMLMIGLGAILGYVFGKGRPATNTVRR